MRSGLWAQPWAGRVLGALIATLGVGQTPMPQPDFHNVRHHDAPGEVCEHHDHLLRWHPGAATAGDVAMLHWHWFLFRGDGSDPSPEGAGQAFHAHTPESAPAPADPTLLVVPDASSRLDLKITSKSGFSPLLSVDAPGLSKPLRAPSPGTRRAPVARRVSLTVSLQRWDC